MGILLTMDKKSKIKTTALALYKSVRKFIKIDKKEKEVETEKKETKAKVVAPVISPAARFRQQFEKLEREDKREKSNVEFSIEEIEDVEEDINNKILESQPSKDNGFTEKEEESVENDVTDIFSKLKIDVNDNKKLITDKKEKVNEVCDDVAESLKNLKLEEGKKKKQKKIKTVTIARTPIVNKNLTSRSHAHPYSQITVNKQAFSGGQVIEYDVKIVQTALNNLESSSKQRDNELNKEECFSLITDLINDQNKNTTQNKFRYQCPGNFTYQHLGLGQHHAMTPVYSQVENNILDEFGISQTVSEVIHPSSSHNFPIGPTDGIEHLLTSTCQQQNECQLTNAMICPEEFRSLFEEQSVYMTPPRSVSMASPLSDFQPSPMACTSSSDYTLSPSDRSSPVFTSDMETYQRIPQFEANQTHIRTETENLKKMNLKQFKNMQKEIVASFSNNECCQKNRKHCMEIFEDRLRKIKAEERINICLKVSRLDLKNAFGVVNRILLNISNGSDDEDLEYTVFNLICGRVLSEQPSWFLGDFGVMLLELAVHRCNAHPVLTRYLVECIRSVSRPEGLEAKDCLLPLRVESKRDNLVIACVLGGDSFADVLYWLVAREPHQPPLFDLGHVNPEGYSALHVACKLHSATSPRIHIAHVLLEHGRVDLWQGDHKGGDTALHLAVNSPTCDLRLVLLLFHQTDQKQWKQLATWNNLGSVTPIEYARCAVKSKQNFPAEVLEFMKKLR